ncbi:hypothetical protein [Stenotrophomonas phage SOVA965]
MDVSVIAKTVVSEVKSMLAVEFEPIMKRLAALESIEFPSAEQAASIVVKDLLESDSLDSLIDLRVTEYLVANPPAAGEKGADGRDGVDGSNGADGQNGLDGKDGADGKDGENGRDGADGKDGIDGKDGRDGIDGKDGLNGEKGLDGKDGKDGEDGVGLAGAVIDRDGELIVTTTKGAAIKLGPVVGRDGEHGLGFDDMSAEADGEGRVTLKFMRGQQVKEFPLSFEIPVYRGYWREGRKCEAGHMLTHEGSVWIAKRANCSKPCLENKEDWQLAVRKGRDGRDGANGRDLGPAPAVKLEHKNG